MTTLHPLMQYAIVAAAAALIAFLGTPVTLMGTAEHQQPRLAGGSMAHPLSSIVYLMVEEATREFESKLLGSGLTT